MSESSASGDGPVRKRRIAFVTTGDARDIRFWSGTPYHMAAALAAEGHEIVHAGPLRARSLFYMKVYARLCKMVGIAPPAPFHAGMVIGEYARHAARLIREIDPDIVFAPASSAFAWNTPAGIPLVYLSDATYRVVANYHPSFRRLSRRSRASADRIERESIARADLLLYPSPWAAKSAVEDYGADPERVHVIAWGANLADAPSRASLPAERKPGPWRLLFVGVNWVEKGAAIAVDALRALRAAGIDAELTICGCTPPEPLEADGLTIIPYLKKSDPEEGARLRQLYRDADFFILPTRADCYGIVFCEAAAYGLPSLAPATGGVPGALSDGETGILLPPDASGDAYAEVIAGLIAKPARLAALRRSSRDAFETRLNWSAWGKRVSALISALPDARKA